MASKKNDLHEHNLDTAFIKVKIHNLDYHRILPVIQKTGSAFIPINRKTANYARKRLEALSKRKVEAYPADFRGQSGYLFLMSED